MVFPVPLTAITTGAPATGLPPMSRAVTVTVTRDAESATIDAGAAATRDWAALTGPTPRPNRLEVTLVVGQYAQAYHLSEARSSLTETVRAWRSYGPKILPLPHPSPRNNIWLARNPWFAKELLPTLRRRVSEALAP